MSELFFILAAEATKSFDLPNWALMLIFGLVAYIFRSAMQRIEKTTDKTSNAVSKLKDDMADRPTFEDANTLMAKEAKIAVDEHIIHDHRAPVMEE